MHREPHVVGRRQPFVRRISVSVAERVCHLMAALALVRIAPPRSVGIRVVAKRARDQNLQ
jgi:hypothetical protein